MARTAHGPDTKTQARRAAQREEHAAGARLIVEAAAGRTCGGGCIHYRGDYCASRKLDGAAIEIYAPGAIACDAWADVVPVKRRRRRA